MNRRIIPRHGQRRPVRWLNLLLACLCWLGLGSAHAHELSMAEMELRETAAGEFIWQWTAAPRGGTQDMVPRWPSACTAQANLLRCGAQGLRGTLSIDGVGQRVSAAIVKVVWRDGQTRVYTLTAGQPEVRLYGAADDARGGGEIAWAYTLLGIEHILGGVDHLLFVLGLLFLVGFKRRLVATITAFTLAHSLTLGASALGWLALRSPPVEATIALSIMLVAAEALHRRHTLAQRWPALVAFGFGLVHGLGFAGALQQIGLPQHHLLLALLTFNLGVELGQLLVVALAAALSWALARQMAGWPMLPRLRQGVLYAMGSVAAYWSIGRVAALVG